MKSTDPFFTWTMQISLMANKHRFCSSTRRGCLVAIYVDNIINDCYSLVAFFLQPISRKTDWVGFWRGTPMDPFCTTLATTVSHDGRQRRILFQGRKRSTRPSTPQWLRQHTIQCLTTSTKLCMDLPDGETKAHDSMLKCEMLKSCLW